MEEHRHTPCPNLDRGSGLIDDLPQCAEAQPGAAARAERRLQRERLLAERIAALLGSAGSPLDLDTTLDRVGLDSLTTVELASAIRTATGRELAAGWESRFRTLRQLLTAVLDEVEAAPGCEEPASVAGVAAPEELPGARLRRSRFADRMAPVLERVARARADGVFFFERPVSGLDGAWVECADGERMLMFATYNYLGLLGHPRLEAAAVAAVERYGTGTHGVRLLGGSLDVHHQLERRLADFVGREAAVTFSSGFMANYTSISTLIGPGDWVIADQFNHASIVDGCAASGATYRIFRHGDMDHLEAILASAPGGATLLVIADALFSLDGDILDLPRVVELCRRYGALLMVDEAHSMGVLGMRGRGIEDHFGMHGVIDILMGTLSKAIPAVGGFVAGSAKVVDFLRFSARGYVFSAALPPAVAAAALAALDVLEEEGAERRARLRESSAFFLAALRQAGFDTGRSCSPIIPLILGSDEHALQMTRSCQQRGVFALPALPPAVPPGTARLRLNVTADHSLADMRYALRALILGRQEVSGEGGLVAESSLPVEAQGEQHWVGAAPHAAHPESL